MTTTPVPDTGAAANNGPWIMFQGWRNLLFYSWPVPAPALTRLLPPGLPVDIFAGTGWVSLVPFLMHGLHLRYLPPIPGTGTFPEVNLRTYVRVRGEPGVFFFSIDAASCLGAFVAHAAFHLPFHRAGIRLEDNAGGFRMHSARPGTNGKAEARLIVSWTPKGVPRRPASGTLESFLLERYASFSPAPAGKLYRGPMLHSDWQVQDAEAEVAVDDLITLAGLAPPSRAVSHYSPGVDTRVCPPQRVPSAE
jgi:hypothetical protein